MNFKCKFFTILLIFTMLPFTGAAETQNKDLPTEDQLIDFLKTIAPADNYTKIASELALSQHPDWKWDIWSANLPKGNSTKLISFYYTAPGTTKGYGSTYLNDKGWVLNRMCYVNVTWICGYKGAEVTEGIIEDNVTHETANNSTVEYVTSGNYTVNLTVNGTNDSDEYINITPLPENKHSTFSMSTKNEETGNSANVNVKIDKPSKWNLDKISDAWKALLYAVHLGGNETGGN